MDEQAVARFLARQEQVVSRRQVLAAGGDDDDVARMLRQRRWARVHPGTYVAHTGPPTQVQREWAAVLHHAPAALAGWSALRHHGVRTGREGGPGVEDAVVHLAVDRERRLRPGRGIVVVRLARFDQEVLSHLSPPRLRLEPVVLDLAAHATSDAAAVAVLTDAVASRRTTAPRLLAALARRSRMRRRALVTQLLGDVATGSHSVLEQTYLVDVERRHGLPRGGRQTRFAVGGRTTYRDVEYAAHATVVELDGRLGHELARDRWSDLRRDVATLVCGAVTLRLGWHQVLDPCRTARAVGQVLQARGWAGQPVPCGPSCPVERGA
ncbi:Transcriptional regulator, AbiEi antitoxin, Type IV TA system [Nocardioides scoriae]|uniref:Transcriptional regulator, AbiEi antitoxin, Type IV TA system n=1 Tax=Nocardioides scoriae TaxID=642780 RepID=A0A1H1YFG4_9ACTN|nr:type IV toxin-antitoxin system AbiEi family antitoxin domain-containing protein [Nocardioides scoriae]SDT20177.1 Transcriptional regulator, AbiEi antitoxin, Type IV TA system [Nocardioides scoriae]